MATQCPAGIDPGEIRIEVANMYQRVAKDPDGEFHFHRGPGYAAGFLGYDASALAELPDDSTSSFAGIGNPHRIDTLGEGESVLDVGCGAGMDLLLAARRVGATGRAVGVDMTPDMLSRARRAAAALGLTHVELREGDAESLPVEDGGFDVLISNGVYNLTTDKLAAFGEAYRALKPGGRLLLADIVVENELSLDVRSDIDLWSG